MNHNEFLRKWRAGELLTTDDLADIIEAIFDELDAIIERLESEAHMGAFDTIPNILIPDDDKDATAAVAFRKKWGWDPHEQIIIRGSFTVADQEDMENASSTLEGKGKKRNLKVRTGSARRTLLERMIVSWTLSKQGQIVPVTPENIGKLPSNYRKPVLEQCDEIAKTMDEEEQEDFLPSASDPSMES